jgi:hypothetical protein
MAEADETPGWRVPCDPVQYVVMFIVEATLFTTLSVIIYSEPGSGGRLQPWLFGTLFALLITLFARFEDRPIQIAVRGRSDAEGQAMRHSLRTGVLPPDASSDAYIEWAIQVVRHKWRSRRRWQAWVSALYAIGSLAAVVVTGEALWLLITAPCAGLAAFLRWDLARMDACVANLQRQIAARMPV